MDFRRSSLGGLGVSHSRSFLALKSLLDIGISIWLQPTCFLCKAFTTDGTLCKKCNQFELVTPPHCLTCGDSISFERNYCGKCEKVKHNLCQIRTQYWLSEEVQKILHEIKFRSDYPSMSFLIKSHLKYISLQSIPHNTWVIPIPLSLSSFIERGFNQSEILAENLAHFHHLKIVPDSLIKTKKTERQSWLNIKERQKNLKGAFEWNKKYTPPESILLVDDVYTTGSTLKECAKVLKKKKVQSVYAWTLFRTPKKQYQR